MSNINHISEATGKAVIIGNKWGYVVSVNDDGKIANGIKNRVTFGWEGFLIEPTSQNTGFISRIKGGNKYVLAISDEGVVTTTPNRVKVGWEEFKFTPVNSTSGLALFYSESKSP